MKAKEFITEGLRDPKDNPCWKGYKPVGTKQKGGRTVPNCVPKESVEEQADWREASAKSNLQPGVPVMIWLGPRNQNPPRDDKKWWERGVVMDSPEWIDGAWRVLVKTDTKSQWPINPERVFVLKKDVEEDLGTMAGAAALGSAAAYGIGHLAGKMINKFDKKYDGVDRTTARKHKDSCACEKCRGSSDTRLKQGVAEETTDVYRKVFKKNGKPVGEVGIDLEASPGNGDWYVKHYASGTDYSGYDTRQDAIDELKYMVSQGLDENYNAEYDDEAGMADNNLETLERAVQGIDELIDAGDNLPEWCQEKIAIAKSMLVNIWDYMRSEEDRGAVAEDWQKANRKDKTPGMSKKAVAAYRREHPGSKLQTAVTTKPSKLKKGSKASKRRKSYCSRSKGQMDMHNIDCSKTPDKAICKSRRRWNCE